MDRIAPLEIANLISHGFYHQTMFADSRGVVYKVRHFSARLSDEFDLRRFPFDTQTLHVVMQPYINPGNADLPIRFAPQDLPSGVSRETYAGLVAWKVAGVDYRADAVSMPGLGYAVPQAEFEIIVKRRTGFYWWMVFLPVLLMVIVSWSIFWVNTREFDWQMKIPIAVMLAMVAFEFVIARDLPRVSYVTFLDSILLTSFVFIFLAAMECVTVHAMIRDNRPYLAEQVHCTSRWAFPLAYACVILILISAIRSRDRGKVPSVWG